MQISLALICWLKGGMLLLRNCDKQEPRQGAGACSSIGAGQQHRCAANVASSSHLGKEDCFLVMV